MPFVDNFAHIGGLVGGLLLGFVVLLHTDARGELRTKSLLRVVCSVAQSGVSFTCSSSSTGAVLGAQGFAGRLLSS